METLTKVHIGVDVSQKRLDICIYPLEKSILQVPNTAKDIQLFMKKLAQYDVERIACESSGGYESLLLKYATKFGFITWQIDPRRVKAFAKAQGIKAKTDAIDASIIASFSANVPNKSDLIKVNCNSKLRQLNERKKELTSMITQEKNRLKHPQYNLGIQHSFRRTIKLLEKEHDKILHEISEIIRTNEELNYKEKLITSVPGVGQATAMSLLAELPELGYLPEKPITALVGVGPFDNQSGNKIGKSFIRDGRKKLRAALYMAALVATKHNEKMKNFYNRLLGAGKTPKVALVAVMRKLLITLNAMLRDGTAWNPV